MGKDFLVTIHDPARVAEWQAIYGTTTINVRSPIAQLADLPGLGERRIYLLDQTLITPDQRQRLVEHISRKWDVPPADVEAEIDGPGAPILADDCTVTVLNPQKWF